MVIADENKAPSSLRKEGNNKHDLRVILHPMFPFTQFLSFSWSRNGRIFVHQLQCWSDMRARAQQSLTYVLISEKIFLFCQMKNVFMMMLTSQHWLLHHNIEANVFCTCGVWESTAYIMTRGSSVCKASQLL